MTFEKNCKIQPNAVTNEEGYFECEINNEWYVRLENFFHYKLDFGHTVSRDLYQTAEIRVYCESDHIAGWGGNFQHGATGTIKVVHVPPVSSYGRPGFLERNLPPLKRAVISGLQEQYIGKVAKMRHIIDEIYMDEKIEEYIVDLVEASRNPDKYKLDIGHLIRYGASPRATIYLAMASKAKSLIEGRGYVTPQDVKTVAMDVLRHRVIVTYEAEAEEKTSEDIIEQILQTVNVP